VFCVREDDRAPRVGTGLHGHREAGHIAYPSPRMTFDPGSRLAAAVATPVEAALALVAPS
jgi:hypothetical protein